MANNFSGVAVALLVPPVSQTPSSESSLMGFPARENTIPSHMCEPPIPPWHLSVRARMSVNFSLKKLHPDFSCPRQNTGGRPAGSGLRKLNAESGTADHAPQTRRTQRALP